MQRKTAVAAATAISMSLVSAAVAIGANFGALGFSASSPAPVAQPSAVSAPVQAPSQSAATGTAARHGEASRREHEDSTPGAAVTAAPVDHEKGPSSDE